MSGKSHKAIRNPRPEIWWDGYTETWAKDEEAARAFLYMLNSLSALFHVEYDLCFTYRGYLIPGPLSTYYYK